MGNFATGFGGAAALLDEVKGGNRQALEKLLSHHRADLRAFIEVRLDRRLAARVDPSDVVQEALVTVTQRMDVDPRRRPSALSPLAAQDRLRAPCLTCVSQEARPAARSAAKKSCPIARRCSWPVPCSPAGPRPANSWRPANGPSGSAGPWPGSRRPIAKSCSCATPRICPSRRSPAFSTSSRRPP